MTSKVSPPRWPLRLMRSLLKDHYVEEIEGDMEELFQDNLEKYSLKKARIIYMLDALKLLRPSLLKQFNPNLHSSLMVKNNVRMAFRIFKREKFYTAVNVFGLASALAIAMLIFQYVQFEFSYESENPNADRLIRITLDRMNGETVVDQDCETNPPAGPLINSEQPEVIDFTRAYHIDQHTIKVGENVFLEPRTYGVDPSFFRLFNYPLIHGNQEYIFREPHQVVLTESTARKYFNTTDVLGKTIHFIDIKTDFEIVGVVSDCPANTHLKFDILLSYPSMVASFRESDNNWNGNNTYTYLLLSDREKYDDFKDNLARLNVRLQQEEKMRNARMVSEIVTDIHLYSNKSFEPETNGDASSVLFLLGVAILVMVIALVNYINLSTSKSLDRAKEVGIRKITGSSMTQLRLQFFTESFLINVISGVVAMVLITLFLQNFRNLAQLPESFSVVDKPMFWYIFILILLISTLLSGVFPAFVLSSFRPAQVLKGKFSHSHRGIFMRQGLVVFQFFITLFLLIQTLVAGEQLQFMKEQDPGFSMERTIVVHVPVGEHKNLKDELLKHPEFEAAGFSNFVPGQSLSYLGTTTGVNLTEPNNDYNYNFNIIRIDHGYVPAVQMELLSGENFAVGANDYKKVIVNEKAIDLWEIPDAQSAIGKRIKLWGDETSEIIGVVKNFHLVSAKSEYQPVLLYPSTAENTFLSVRTTAGDLSGKVTVLKEVYEAQMVNSPFEYFFMDQEFDKQYRADEQFREVFRILTGFALVIALLGLYGLASFTISRRTKEIGIRKVLGAKISQVIFLLSKDFVRLVVYAVLLALPVSYYILQNWLSQFPFRITLNVWFFLIPATLLILLAFLTVLAKTYLISNVNPAHSLRSE